MLTYTDPNETIIANSGEYGALEVYRYIKYWINENRRRYGKADYREGRYWMYQSLHNMASAIRGMTVSKLRTIMRKLKSFGVILCGRFNHCAYDRTTWYAIAETQCNTDLLKQTNNSDKNTTVKSAPMPTYTNITKQDTKSTYSASRPGYYDRRKAPLPPRMITRPASDRENDNDDPLETLRELANRNPKKA